MLTLNLGCRCGQAGPCRHSAWLRGSGPRM